jgi:hypothetical protein
MTEQITLEQEALMPQYVEKWQRIALSTERIEYERAIEAVQAAYAENGFREPEIIFCESPYQGMAELVELKQKRGNLGTRFNQKIQRHNKWSFAQIWQQPTAVDYQLKRQLSEPLIYLNFLFRPLTEHLEKQFLLSQLDFALFYSTISAESLADSYCLWDFGFSVLGWKHDPIEWATSEALLKTCGWIFPFKQVCIICDRPTKIAYDEYYRLHAVGEPAIAFTDGFGVYAYRGALMPEKYSQVPPSQWQIQDYLEETNPRLRQAFVELLPNKRLEVSWLLREDDLTLRQLLLDKLSLTRIQEALLWQDNYNFLSQAWQDKSGSLFWVVCALLQNQQEPRLQQLISQQKKGFRLKELRKTILIDSLERILGWLPNNFPSYATGFLPGLSNDEIEERVTNLPFKLPKEVYDLYNWRNGTDSEAGIFVYHYLWDLDTVLEISSGINNSEGLFLPEGVSKSNYLLPIFEFEGEYFAVLVDSSEVETAPVYHICGEGGGTNLAFNSLTTMMLTIAESYETGVYQVDSASSFLEWNLEKFRLIRHKYNPGTVDCLYYGGG